MLIEVGEQLVSSQVFERKFVCDLNACKGACCIEGNSGAPLQLHEIDLLEEQLDEIEPYMRNEGKEAVQESGVFYMDDDNEPVTTLVNGVECAFVYFDEKGITKCAIETAYRDGKIDFNKPQSCHLYPIRIKRLHDKKVLTFEDWQICTPACACGEQLDLPVYKFLQEPIKRVFGEKFVDELALVAEQWILSRK
ncbi:MAG: DUF3109 family protein [Flavobacteriia bacterium]